MPGIDDILYRLGSTWHSAADIVRQHPAAVPPTQDPETWIKAFCADRGLDRICVEHDRGPTELLHELMREFFDTSGVAPGEVEMLIYGGFVEFGEAGGRPFRLTHELGLPATTEVFWHFIGCATGISAVNIALARLAATGKQHALILLNCIRNDSDPDRPRVTVDTVCGDAVMLLHVTTGPARWEVVSNRVTCAPEHHAYGLLPEGRADPFGIIRHGVGHIRDHVGDAVPGLAAILPVYSGFAQWPRFAKALGIPADRIRLDTLAEGGHINCVDPLRLLADLTPQLPPGADILLYSQSLGLAFDTTLISLGAQRR